MLELILLTLIPAIALLSLFILSEAICLIYGYGLILFYFRHFKFLIILGIIISIKVLNAFIENQTALLFTSLIPLIVGLIMQEIVKTRQENSLLKGYSR